MKIKIKVFELELKKQLKNIAQWVMIFIFLYFVASYSLPRLLEFLNPNHEFRLQKWRLSL